MALGAVTIAVAAFLVLRPAPPPPLPILAAVGPWTLVDDRDQPFGASALRGKVWVASFIFTRCLMACPKITAAQHAVFNATPPRDDVYFVTFTVDPKFDTPEVLTRYRQTRALPVTGWTFVTGEPAAVFHVLRDQMFSHIGEEKIHGDPAEGLIDIAHLERLAVFDRDGNLRGTFAIDVEGQAALQGAVQTLLASSWEPAGGD